MPELERSFLGGPFAQPAVENRDLLVPESAEQPPQPRGPLADGVVVHDDERVGAGPEGTGGTRELLSGGSREWEPAIRVAELVQQIREDGSRDMTVDEVLLVPRYLRRMPVEARNREHFRI